MGVACLRQRNARVNRGHHLAAAKQVDRLRERLAANADVTAD